MNKLNLNVTQPLGIMYLASYLRNFRSDDIRIIDMRCHQKNAEKTLCQTLGDFEPDVVGISCLTIESKQIDPITRKINEISPRSTVVIGGPHATAYPYETLNKPYVDFVVKGEGEETFLELVGCIERSGDPSAVRSIGFRKGGQSIFTPERGALVDVNDIPYPAWDLIEMDSYFGFESMANISPRRYMCLFTSRGCPYQCTYCHNIFGKKYRARNIDNIIGEIRMLKDKYGINEFEIVDDCFNLDGVRAAGFFNRICEESLAVRMSFPNGLRADLLDEDMLRLMSSAGVNWMSFAVETASPRLQKMIKKNLDLKKVKMLIKKAIENNIYVNGFFMFGFPTETEKEVRQTIKFALDSHLCQALFFLLVPFKNTALGELAYRSSSGLDLAQEHYFDCHFNMSNVPDKKLLWLHRHAYIRFYFSLRRIYYYFRYHPRKDIRQFLRWARRVIDQIFHA